MGSAKTRIFDPWETEAWLPPPEETIDAWAERCLVLPRGVSSISGPLSFDLTPFIREPLRAVTDPDVEEVVWCTSAQFCKTTFLIVVETYFLKNDPWNMFHIMPSEDEAVELKVERLIPIIMESPELRSLVKKGDRGQFAGDTVRLNGCTITFRGSHSPSALASKPAKIAICDEIDKWDQWAGREADPVALVNERLKTFHDSKLLKCSTPVTKEGRIWQELGTSTNERYHVPCPFCGTYQPLVFGNGAEGAPGIKWPQDVRDPAKIDTENLAWYECVKCQERIEESNKRQMVMDGVWCPRGMKVKPSGKLEGDPPPRRKVGYHGWAAYSLWPKASWSKIAAMFLRSKDKPQDLMNFKNSWLAEPWHVTISELKDAHVRARCSDYWLHELPEGADVVTFGVDVQSTSGRTYQYYVVRAWGQNGQSWLINYGTTTGWAGLYSVVFETDYRQSNGMPATRIQPIVDSGFLAPEVYDWCWENEGIAYKGDARGRRHLDFKEMPRAPESDEMIPFAIADPNFYKTELHRLIRQEDKWFLPRSMDEEYFAHLVAEQQQRVVEKKTGRNKTEWKLKSDGLPNHYFDCEVMNLVAADLAELGNRSHPRELDVPADSPSASPSAAPGPPIDPSGGMVRTFS